MLEPWARRAFGWAALAALLHSAAWTGFFHHYRQQTYDNLEECRVVIEKLEYSRRLGNSYSRMNHLLLTLRRVDAPAAEAQEIISSGGPDGKAYEYYLSHRAGDVVAAWASRKSRRIDDVFPRARPDAMQLYLTLLPTLGLATAFLVFFIFGVATGTRVPRPASRSDGNRAVHADDRDRGT